MYFLRTSHLRGLVLAPLGLEVQGVPGMGAKLWPGYTEGDVSPAVCSSGELGNTIAK